ncbi:MAG: 1,4-dihydroxy-2-naphthoate octaprenyltransferase [Chthoniobacteraceae bacterium]
MSLKPWILAARPKTLGAAIAPVMVGSALGWRLSGDFCVWLMLATLGSCVCLQIAVNFFNDAVDGLKGSDTKERLGPVRITASGMMPPATVLKVGAGVLVLATLLAVPLVWMRGWPIIAIGIPSLYFCYGYTGGPWPLAYRGLGELFVVLFFGLIAVTGSAFVQSGQWHVEALVAGLQIGMLSTVLIAINNLRDVDEDRKTGKKTLAVRFGVTFARLEIAGLLIGSFLMGVYWLPRMPLGMFVALQIIVLFTLLILNDLRKPPSSAYNQTLAKAGACLLLYSIAFTISLVLVKGGAWAQGYGH